VYELIASNKRRSALLIAGFVVVVVIAGAAVGVLIGYGWQGTVLALVFSAAMAFVSYWKADAIALAVSRARPADPQQYRRLYNLVEGLTIAGGLPMPRIYIIDDPAPNAFATGRNPQHAAVAATSGLVQRLNRDELKAVLAHELGHVRNRDSLTMTLTAVLAGAIGLLAQSLFWFGGFGGRDRNSPLGGPPQGGPLGGIGALLVMLLAPVAAMLVQLAISRSREYEADRAGAALSGSPRALASALQKISGAASQIPNPVAERHPASAHLFIVNPLHGMGADNLFSTHPSTENRIARLLAMAGCAAPEPPQRAATRIGRSIFPTTGEAPRRGPWG
jgi:heat shock protein HtpX